jgi:hypothetical protein
MRITQIGSDFITITEDNLYNEELRDIPRVHLIKLAFFSPTEEKVKKVLSFYPKTNRFIIEENIRTYNYILKWTNKKYYIQNKQGVGLISFFRKNNKVLLDFSKLSPHETHFILNYCFEDILKNLEVIMITNEIYEEKEEILKLWNGNVILHEEGYDI